MTWKKREKGKGEGTKRAGWKERETKMLALLSSDGMKEKT
jgi:hypothetical protein